MNKIIPCCYCGDTENPEMDCCLMESMYGDGRTNTTYKDTPISDDEQRKLAYPPGPPLPYTRTQLIESCLFFVPELRDRWESGFISMHRLLEKAIIKCWDERETYGLALEIMRQAYDDLKNGMTDFNFTENK